MRRKYLDWANTLPAERTLRCEQDVRQFLDRFTFPFCALDRFKLRVERVANMRGGLLMVGYQCYVPNQEPRSARPVGTVIPVSAQRIVPLPISERTLAVFALELVQQAWTHEMEECVRFDEDRVLQPHPVGGFWEGSEEMKVPEEVQS